MAPLTLGVGLAHALINVRIGRHLAPDAGFLTHRQILTGSSLPNVPFDYDNAGLLVRLAHALIKIGIRGHLNVPNLPPFSGYARLLVRLPGALIKIRVLPGLR